MPKTSRKSRPATDTKGKPRAKGKVAATRNKAGKPDTGNAVTDTVSFPGFLPSTIQKK